MAFIVPAKVGEVINIGRAGEHKATKVIFDVSDWIDEFGSGTFKLIVQQGGGNYSVPWIVRNGTNIEWEITSSNTAIVGAGKCELILTVGEKVVKSIIYDILVTNALDIEVQGDIPDAISSWITQANEDLDNIVNVIDTVEQYVNAAAYSADEAEAAANKIINLRVNGTTTSGNTASVTKSESGGIITLSFTLPKGDKGDTGDKGDKGDTGATGATGATGPQGPTGPAATIAIGTVTTGNAGSSATVTNSGTSTNATLNFTIPKGDKGDTGNAAGFGTPTAVIDNSIGSVGIPGVSISASGSNTAKVFNFKFGNLKGDKGDTGNAAGFGTPTASINNTVGTPSVTVTASGENTAKVFNFAFSNLKGEKGDKGNTGAITVGNVITGNAGSSAIITNSGTSTDAVLNFTIPKGDKGDTGAITVGTVTTGNAGSSVIITNSGTPSDAVLNFTIPKGDKGEQGTGFAGTLTSLPAANSTNYNAYKDKVWVYNGHAYSIIQSNNSYTWVDGGTAAGITANLYDWTSN